MSFTVKVSATAMRDLQQGIDYYQSQQKGLGRKFEHEVNATINQIKEYPKAASFLTENIRYKVMAHFPYIIVHEVYNETVYILRVFNTSLSPDKL